MTKLKRHRGRSAGAVLTAAAVVGTSLFVAVPAASAAANIEVNSLGLGGNAVAGTCEATVGAGDCTLRGALEIANANTGGPANITFAAALAGAGQIQLSGGAENSMQTGQIANPVGNVAGSIGPGGSRYLIDSQDQVIIDFTNLDGIEDFDSQFAGIHVASEHGVELKNLKNLRAGEAGIAISGKYVTLDNVELKDNASIIQEVGVALLDGLSNVVMNDVTIQSPWTAGIVVDTAATVSNIQVDGLASRGIEAWSHIDFEDDSTVNNFSVTNSVLGAADETQPSHGFWMNPRITVTGLEVTDSEFHSWGKNFLFFEGGDQEFTGTVIAANDFSGTVNGQPGYDAGNISRVIGHNTADWNDLVFNDNNIDEAQAVVFAGSLVDAEFVGNTFTNVNDGAYAALQLGTVTDNVYVGENSFNKIWAHDTIRVEGTSATDVIIEDNDIFNLTASISRSAVRIAAPGTGNFVQNNNLQQDISGADASLPVHVDNHWAIYNSANAATKDASVGWSIVENFIDGFGGKNRSEAPIVHNAIGKLNVMGNTFGVHTRGGKTTDVEHSGYWFFWNVWDSRSNNTVQTFRAEDVAYDGTNATFKAVKPAKLIGNNDATEPVTLHVYWTAVDHAEEYLGYVENVTEGQTVTVPTAHTDGFVRVQTVDANGNVSQYSSLDPNAPSVVPAAPEVTEVTKDSAAGTGTPGATVVIRDAEDEVVAEAPVDDDGKWVVPADKPLTCNTDYTATQRVEGVEGDTVEFSTKACDAPEAPAAPVIKGATATEASGTGEPGATVTLRDSAGKVLGTATVAQDGSWVIEGKLPCGETITATQRIGEGLESPAGSFKTAACAAHDTLENTGASAPLVAAGIAGLLLAAGASMLVVRRRRVS